jgi:hypothetical protein
MLVAYRYREPSALVTRTHLALETCDAAGEREPFFRGRVLTPQAFATNLAQLGTVAQSRFFVPMSSQRKAAMLDPIVTHADALRLEAFSSCCSAYARLDVLPAGLDGERLGHGTTNVDLNAPLRAALTGVAATDTLTFEVGRAHIAVETPGERHVERKVALPARWLAGLLSAQFCQASLERRFTVRAAAMAAFLSTLSRQGGRQNGGHLVADGPHLRLTPVRRANGCAVEGAERLHLLGPSLRHATAVHVFADDTGTSLFVVEGQAMRFNLLLTPSPTRGFSGEGRALEALAQARGPFEARVEAHLAWEKRVTAEDLTALYSERSDAPPGPDSPSAPGNVGPALARLGARGLVGHDRFEEVWFRRALPFDLRTMSRIPSRLDKGRALAKADTVTLSGPDDAIVAGATDTYRVRRVNGAWRCDCAWFLKHAHSRGPCAHILATGFALERARQGNEGRDGGDT